MGLIEKRTDHFLMGEGGKSIQIVETYVNREGTSWFECKSNRIHGRVYFDRKGRAKGMVYEGGSWVNGSITEAKNSIVFEFCELNRARDFVLQAMVWMMTRPVGVMLSDTRVAYWDGTSTDIAEWIVCNYDEGTLLPIICFIPHKFDASSLEENGRLQDFTASVCHQVSSILLSRIASSSLNLYHEGPYEGSFEPPSRFQTNTIDHIRSIVRSCFGLTFNISNYKDQPCLIMTLCNPYKINPLEMQTTSKYKLPSVSHLDLLKGA